MFNTYWVKQLSNTVTIVASESADTSTTTMDPSIGTTVGVLNKSLFLNFDANCLPIFDDPPLIAFP